MRDVKVKNLTFMALLMALTLTATIAVRIPVPATQGYIHFGDTILILSVLILGKKQGALAGALGQSLADLFGGYAIFAPVTFIAKLLMGMLIGLAIEKIIKYNTEKKLTYIVGAALFIIAGWVTMTGSYYFAEAAMYGSFITPLIEIPANLIQFSAGSILAGVVGALLYKTPARNYFKINS